MSPARTTRARSWLRVAVRALAGVIVVMLGALVVAMYVDDSTIDSAPLRANATVLAVSPLRTGIEFVDQNGLTIRPSGGVLYPGLLRVGQQFVVEYSASKPEVVRVAGRTAANGLLMVLFAALGTVLIAAGLLAVMRGSSAKVGRRLRAVG